MASAPKPCRRPFSCIGQGQLRFALQTECDNPRPTGEQNPNGSLSNHHPFRIQSLEDQRQPYRIHSTLASKSFWRGLHQAVRQGNGNLAEEIAEQVLQDYFRLVASSQSSEMIVDSDSNSRTGNYHTNEVDFNNTKSAIVQNSNGDNLPPLLDSQIFSLVLQAWKNSDSASLHSALRAHNLLIQMAALADQDVLCDPPVLEDYLAVLECWHHAASRNEEGDRSSNNTRQKEKQNGNIALVLQHVEELWDQMKERQRREMMTNQTPHFTIDEKAHELIASLLAKAGKATQAEQVVREAVAQQLGSNVRRYSFPDPTAPEKDACENSVVDDINRDEYDPQVGLNLCHTVLEAHLRSKESRAPERAEAFLQRMRSDRTLPNPNVRTYNLVLERWMDSSKASRSVDVTTSIASKVEDLIHQMKDEDRIQPNLVSYQYGIDALARSSDAVRAETMLANLVKDYFLQYDADLKPPIAPFQSVLWAYSKAATQRPAHRRIPDAPERAESILNNMKELSALLDTYPTVWSYNIVMKCWAHSRSPDAAARVTGLYEELVQNPLRAEDNANGSRHAVGVEQGTEMLPETERPSDLKPDTISMNTVLNVLSIHESAARTEQKLFEFFDAHFREPQQNPCPDTIAFSTTINAWSNSSNPNAPDRADSLLQKLVQLYDSEKKKIYKPDIVTYTNVMQCWIKSKRPEAPEKVEAILRELQRMERDGDAAMKPDAACWNSVISAWGAAGNGERAEALFFEMLDGSKAHGGSSPTSITLTNALKSWTKTKSPEASHRALELLAKMEKLYEDGLIAVKPNVVHYSVVLDCLAYARNSSAAERAETMLQRMIDSEDPNLQPNVVSYNCVIKAWSYARDPRSASKITSTLRDLIDQSDTVPKMRPNENTFGTILKFLADSDLPDKAKRAMAIENLMNIFLERGPKEWIKKELRRCLSSTERDGISSCVNINEGKNDGKEINKLEAKSEAELQQNNEHLFTSTGSCRGKRANNRFNNEVKVKNLIRRPITGKPDAHHVFDADSHSSDEFCVRDALVRVRLVGESTFDKSQHLTFCKSDNKDRAFSLVVVDGNSEYSCQVLDVQRNIALDIKGGQFLNISYYWYRGEPIVVKIQDAVNGNKIMG